MSDSQIQVWGFYTFQQCQPDEIRARLLQAGGEVRGLIILAEEGINATISGIQSELDRFWGKLSETFDLTRALVKRSQAPAHPFKKLVIKIRPEIVTSGDLSLHPKGIKMLSPEEWHQLLNSGEELILLDTRNIFETAIGKFRGAIDPQIKSFPELPERLKELSIPKDKKVLMYCTGGIRCEKASEMLFREGYEEVYQLHGGILDYLKEFPNQHFEGECFVFDERVAVDQELQPSLRYGLCPNCGKPAESVRRCRRCSKEAKVCPGCIQSDEIWCSLDCARRPEREGLERVERSE